MKISLDDNSSASGSINQDGFAVVGRKLTYQNVVEQEDPPGLVTEKPVANAFEEVKVPAVIMVEQPQEQVHETTEEQAGPEPVLFDDNLILPASTPEIACTSLNEKLNVPLSGPSTIRSPGPTQQHLSAPPTPASSAILSLQPHDLTGSLLVDLPELEDVNPVSSLRLSVARRVAYFSAVGIVAAAAVLSYQYLAPTPVPVEPEPVPVEEAFLEVFSSSSNFWLSWLTTAVSVVFAVASRRNAKVDCKELKWEPLGPETMCTFLQECRYKLDRNGHVSRKGEYAKRWTAYHQLSCRDIRFILERFGQCPPPRTLKNRMIKNLVQRYTETLQCMKKKEILHVAAGTISYYEDLKKAAVIEKLVEAGF